MKKLLHEILDEIVSNQDHIISGSITSINNTSTINISLDSMVLDQDGYMQKVFDHTSGINHIFKNYIEYTYFYKSVIYDGKNLLIVDNNKIPVEDYYTYILSVDRHVINIDKCKWFVKYFKEDIKDKIKSSSKSDYEHFVDLSVEFFKKLNSKDSLDNINNEGYVLYLALDENRFRALLSYIKINELQYLYNIAIETTSKIGIAEFIVVFGRLLSSAIRDYIRDRNIMLPNCFEYDYRDGKTILRSINNSKTIGEVSFNSIKKVQLGDKIIDVSKRPDKTSIRLQDENGNLIGNLTDIKIGPYDVSAKNHETGEFESIHVEYKPFCGSQSGESETFVNNMISAVEESFLDSILGEPYIPNPDNPETE